MGSLTSGSASVTVSSTTGLFAGENVTGSGIPSGTTILTINGSTGITLSKSATASGSQSLTAVDPVIPTIAPNGSFTFTFANPQSLITGNFKVAAIASYTQYPALGSTESDAYIQINNTTPGPVTDFRLNPASDTGIVGDNVTSDRTPQFIGTAGAGDQLELFQLFGFTGTLATGSATVTGLSTTTGLAAGQPVTGSGIPSGTKILSVNSSAGTLTLSATATSTGSENLTAMDPVIQNTAIAQPVVVTGTLASGSAAVTGIASTTGLVAGQIISGTGIPSGTTILAVDSQTKITLSAKATSSGCTDPHRIRPMIPMASRTTSPSSYRSP